MVDIDARVLEDYISMLRGNTKKSKPVVPCGLCGDDVEDTRCIECEPCLTWYHRRCANIPQHLWERWSNATEPFLCSKCVGDPFDYRAGIVRLASAAGRETLYNVAVREELLVKDIKLDNGEQNASSPPQLPVDAAVDRYSQHLLEKNGFEGKALQAQKDGSCLFHSISMAINGDTSLALELRYKTSLYMILYPGEVKKSHDNEPNIDCVSPRYNEATQSCASLSGYSSAWTIMALSLVIQRQIRSMYPLENGSTDKVPSILNAVFGKASDLPVISILWTRATPRHGQIWIPDHFVPVIDKVPKSSSTTEESDMSDSDSSVSGGSDRNEINFIDSDTNTKHRDIPEQREETDNEMTDLPGDRLPQAGYSSGSDLTESNSDLPVEMSDSDNESPLGQPLPAGKFLDVQTLLRIFSDAESSLQAVPTGVKNDTYFVVDNVENEERRKRGEHSTFWDDRGAWGHGSTSKTLFMKQLNGTKKVVLSNGQYCLERRVEKKWAKVPLVPQPNAANIISLHRFYVKHRDDKTYEKRVSWIEDSSYKSVAVYEYKGNAPNQNPHGRAHAGNNPGPYIRQKPETLNKVKDQLIKGKKVGKIYGDSDMDLRNTRVAHNAKNRLRRELGEKHSANFADQVAAVEDMQHRCEFIKMIIRQQGKIPTIILYNEQQILDMKRFCCPPLSASSTVLGVDKTFNLGQLYVTVTVFQNLGVKNRRNHNHPLFVGPLFLHGNSDTDVYFQFFQHIAGQLHDAVTLPVVGSDEEKAMRTAIARAFPGSARMSCTRHIRNNLKAYLADKVGLNKTNRNRIISELFAIVEDGKDVGDVSDRLEIMLSRLPENVSSHLNKHVCPLLIENARALEKPGLINCDAKWMNNNCESVNHVLKQTTGWQTLKLVDLVQKLEGIVKQQYREVIRSFPGLGDFYLDREFRKFAVLSDDWALKTAVQKERHMRKFQLTYKEGVIRSTEGDKSVLEPKHGGKKPGQRKRKRTAKTTSCNKKTNLT